MRGAASRSGRRSVGTTASDQPLGGSAHGLEPGLRPFWPVVASQIAFGPWVLHAPTDDERNSCSPPSSSNRSSRRPRAGGSCSPARPPATVWYQKHLINHTALHRSSFPVPPRPGPALPEWRRVNHKTTSADSGWRILSSSAATCDSMSVTSCCRSILWITRRTSVPRMSNGSAWGSPAA